MKNSFTKYHVVKQAKNYLLEFVERIPVALPASLAVFSVVSVCLLILGQFKDYLLAAIGVPLALLTFYIVFRLGKISRPGSKKEIRIFDFLALLGVIIWALVNMHYTSQNVFVYRDPAVYTVTAAWLIDNETPTIMQNDVLGGGSKIVEFSPGFYKHDSSPELLFPHGQHLLPALLGIAGRLTDSNVMLHMNPIFGGIALLAVYGFGRLLVRPGWAFLATSALAVSLPMLYFSRDNYTEPLAMIFTFGALSLLWVAQSTKRSSLYFLAGITAGTGLLTRIDAYLALIGFSAALLLILALSAGYKSRKATAVRAGLFMLGAALAALVSWLNITILSKGYYEYHRSLMMQEITALGVLLIVGIAFCLLIWRTNILRKLDTFTYKWRPWAAFTIILLLAMFLFLRPYWAVETSGYKIFDIGGVQTPIVYNALETDGEPYPAENITSWIWWYLGPGLALAGLLGTALMARRASRDKSLLLIPGVFVFLSTAIIFLAHPSITPDQIWASRRLLPLVMPFIAIFGIYAISVATIKYWRKGVAAKILLIIFTLYAVLGPLIVSRPFLLSREGESQYRQVQSVCEALPKNAAVLWLGTMSSIGIQPTRTYCKVPAEGFEPYENSLPTQQELAQAAEEARKKGYVPVVGVTGSEISQLINDIDNLTLVSAIEYNSIEMVFGEAPDEVVTNSRAIYMGILQEDGTVKLLNN